jgi:colanic acid biosynthesis glycosyl transferase WcaI
MRLLLVSQYFWPENFRVNDLVAELLSRGHEVTILTGLPNYPSGKVFKEFRDDPQFFSNYQGAEIIRVPLIPRGNKKLILFLNYLTFAISASIFGAWKLRNRKFDVIFTCQLSPVTVAIPALIIKKIKKIPMILWVLDIWPDSLQAVGVIRSKLLLSLIGKLVSIIYNHSDLILVQSRSFVSVIGKYTKENKEILYFPSWSDLVFDKNHIKIAPEIPLKKNCFNIVFTGNIGNAQDFPSILKAAENLKNLLSVRWLIIGDGSMVRWVEKEIKARGLEDCFFLLGKFPNERMPSFMMHADALLISLDNKPIFGLTIPAKLQVYLSSGIPILGMIDGEAKKIIHESGAGLACSAKDFHSLVDAILKLSAMSPKEREVMGERGLKYGSQQFDKSKLMDRLELLLEKLVLKVQKE